MSRRRAPGEGSLRKRKDGRWEASLTVGHTARGNPKRRFVYARTRTKVVTKLEELRGEAAGGGVILPDSLTMAAFLERWLEGKERSCRPSTAANYRATLDRFVLPELGDKRLQKLTALDVHGLLTRLEKTKIPIERTVDGSRRKVGERPLAPRTVRYVHGLLVDALARAVEWHLIPANPALAIAIPPKPRPVATVWSSAEVRAFLRASIASRYHAGYVLALTCGMRRGEILGLRTSDLDLEEGTVAIRRTVISLKGRAAESSPKTARGRRTLHLPGEARAALAARIASVQAEHTAADSVGLWSGDADPWVFGTAVGRPTNPRNLLRDFYAILARTAPCRRIRFHDLRHTYGSHAAAHVSPPALSSRMGHHATSYTVDVYAHDLPAGPKEAALGLDELLGVEQEKPN